MPWYKSSRSQWLQSKSHLFRFSVPLILWCSLSEDARRRTADNGRRFLSRLGHTRYPGNRCSPGKFQEISLGYTHPLPSFQIHWTALWKPYLRRSPGAMHRSAHKACERYPAAFWRRQKYRPGGNNAANVEYHANNVYWFAPMPHKLLHVRRQDFSIQWCKAAFHWQRGAHPAGVSLFARCWYTQLQTDWPLGRYYSPVFQSQSTQSFWLNRFAA